MTVFIFQAAGQRHIVKEQVDGEVISYCHKRQPSAHQMSWDGKFPVCPVCFHRMNQTIDSMKDTAKRHDHTLRVLGWHRKMLYDIVDNQRPEHNKANEHEFKEGSFPFIPHGLERTMEDLYNLKNALPEIKEWSGHRKKRLRSDRPSRFLDAGCGPGNIMLAAHTISLVDNYHGIEFFPETFDRAKSLLGVDNGKAINRGMKLFKDDILKFSKYKDYDIIYYYCPFADPQRQVLFEEKVEDDMRIGAILLGNLKKSGAVRKDYRFKLLPGQFADAAYIKIKGGKRKVSGVKKQSER